MADPPREGGGASRMGGEDGSSQPEGAVTGPPRGAPGRRLERGFERALSLLTDLFLVGATLMIAAFGFYDLFVTRIDAGEGALRLPGWLRMRDLNDLKARVISMIILVAAVTFVDVVVETKDGGLSTFYLGAAVALVIAALTVFLRFGRADGEGGS